MPRFKFYSGFSLVELMIAIALIGVVTAVAIPNLKNFSNTQEIDGAAAQLVSVLRNAQSSAASGINCPSGMASTSWQVNLNTSGASDTYSLAANCASGTTPMTVLTSAFSPTPASQVTFDAVTDLCTTQNSTIYFTNLQTTYQCGTSTPVTGTIKITLSKTGITPKTVVIESGGVIRIE